MSKPAAIVVGAGIVGLATARALAVKGFDVTIFERGEFSIGASIRNFGMIWPIGQPAGKLYERAIRSRQIWKEISDEAKIWRDEVGSLHLAYHDDELAVMTEFADEGRSYRNCEIINAQKTLELSPAVNANGLKGALWSSDEMIIESRVAVAQVAAYLQEKYGVNFRWNTAITKVQYPSVYAGTKQWSADMIYVCSGVDFETLYPEIFAETAITKCKLQMMRITAQPDGWRIGPSLCGGLTLIHYSGFKVAPSLPKLKQRYENELPDLLKWGIHVMVSQNDKGELTIGDSHEYGLTHDPFDKQFINKMVIDYLHTFTNFKNWEIAQSWNGMYPKLTDSKTELVLSPEDGVTVINGIGGTGMTLSFGLAEEVVNGDYQF